MKTKLLIVFILCFIALEGLNAKTIWIKDLTDNRFSKFYNLLWENLKDTKYGNYCKYVTDNKKIDEKVGDVILQINGLYFDLSGGDIQVFTIIMCEVDDNLHWNYGTMYQGGCSWQYISDQAMKAKKEVIEFLNENFEI